MTVRDSENEMIMTNRLIKKEVIDIADLVETVSKVILAMNEKIDANDAFNRNVNQEII
jgi:ATP:corrinoid adenosyltransferase